MRIACISDLHIGNKDNSDMFGHVENKFIDFMNYLENDFDKIFLLGDIFELLMPDFPFDYSTRLNQCIKAYPKISEKIFNNNKYTYIPGNHDYNILNINKDYKLYHTLNINNYNIGFIHGHQFDFWNKNFPTLCSSLVWGGGMLLKQGLCSIYEKISHMEHKMTDPGDIITNFHKRALNFAINNKLNIIVLGHSHVCRKMELDNVLLLNSGTCSKGRLRYLEIDLLNNKFMYHKLI